MPPVIIPCSLHAEGRRQVLEGPDRELVHSRIELSAAFARSPPSSPAHPGSAPVPTADHRALVFPQDPDRGGDDEDHNHHYGNNAEDQLEAAHAVPPRDALVVAPASQPGGSAL